MSTLAHRYAQTLYDICKKEGVVESVSRDLQRWLSTLSELENLKKMLVNPALRSSKTVANILQTLTHGSHTTSIRFIRFLESKGRRSILPEIPAAFNSIWERDSLKIRIHVISAIELSTDQKAGLLLSMKKKLKGYDLMTDFLLDKTLLGGLRIRYEDTIIEYNIKQKLKLIRHKLAA